MSRHGLLRSLFAAAALLGAAGVFAASAEPLRLEVYNPGEKAIFAVSSELLVGQREAMLIDAQFSRADAEQLVKRIQASGKTLSTIYISHGDPDFYFGLDVLKAAFPEAKILATAQTVAHIQATKDAKLAYWGPILKDNAPTSLVVPEPLKGDQLKLEGHALKVVDLKGPSPDRTVLWIPSLKTVVGGVLVESGSHVWTADTQTQASRQAWVAMLDRIEALQPRRVVPGHFTGEEPKGLDGVRFTRDLPEGPGSRTAQGQGFRRAGRGDEAPLPEPAGRGRPGAERQGAQGRDAVALSRARR